MDTEQALDQFEQAWRRGARPDIREFLASTAGPSVDRASRHDLLEELVMIDLWYRWRQAARGQTMAGVHGCADQDTVRPEDSVGLLPERPRLEDYLRQCPELGPLEAIPPAVIGEEYRARQRWGDRPDHEDYLSRFRPQAAELKRILDGIDEELSGETVPDDVIPTSQGWRTALEAADRAPGARPEPPVKIGKYHIVGILEEGGQAHVYRAVHPTLSKELVIKLCRQPLGSGLTEMDRLIAEGKLLAELDHPNLARVYDLDFHENRPFLVMEYVRGRNLRHYAREHRCAPREASLLVAKAARALAVAHARGIVHQDIKPGNIIIDESGEPRVIDFGLARLRPAWVEVADEPAVISGTVQYMSPEQARGESQSVDPRTDVFALGAVLYFLLVGKAPFAGEDILASLKRARQCDFDASALRRAGVPRRLEAVCLRAMQREPADRYGTAEAMAADLERFAAGPRRLKRAMAAAAGLVAVLLLAFGVWAMRGGQSARARPMPETAKPADPAMALLGRPLRHDFQLKFEVIGHKIGEGGEVVLADGERVAFRIEAERDCYVGIWHVDHRDVVTQLFPNEHDYDHFLPAGEPRTIPGEMEYAIRVTASEGREYLHVIASTKRWEAPLGEQHGPYVVFATPDQLKRWQTGVRAVVLDKDRSPTVSEQLVLFDVRKK